MKKKRKREIRRLRQIWRTGSSELLIYTIRQIRLSSSERLFTFHKPVRKPEMRMVCSRWQNAMKTDTVLKRMITVRLSSTNVRRKQVILTENSAFLSSICWVKVHRSMQIWQLNGLTKQKNTEIRMWIRRVSCSASL